MQQFSTVRRAPGHVMGGARPRASVIDQRTTFALAAIMFTLCAANASPYWWSSGFFALFLIPLALTGRGVARALSAALAPGNAIITVPLVVFTGVSILSTLASPTMESLRSTLFRCIFPFLIYLCFVGIEINRPKLNIIMAGFICGAAFMFARGAFAYLQEWGIPDLQTIMWARFDTRRMKTYQDVTVGNLAQMGSYAILVLAPMVLASVHWYRNWLPRLLVSCAIALGVANIAFCGARTAVLCLVVIVGVAIVSAGARKSILFLALAAGVALLTASEWMPAISDVSFLERFAPSLMTGGLDESAEERRASILVGLDIFWAHPVLGVGPGNSAEHNFYSIPHNSFVHVASELGLIGVLVFVFINMVVFLKTWSALRSASASPAAMYRLIWLFGPAMWLLYGFTGIPFNMSHALLWAGIAHAMLGLSSAVVVPSPPRYGGTLSPRGHAFR
ncbi:MAG: O-antigen ligase family protein [Hyphomicrobiaceae bacterium]